MDRDTERKETTADGAVDLPHGTYSRIARRLKVSPNHVREVALGRRTSPRVWRSIETERRRLARLAGQDEQAA